MRHPDPAGIDIVVCVPTFRRPAHLRLTLDSLLAQTIARPFAVVVVENDASAREGKAVADGYFAAGRLNGTSVVEPNQGNCHAINTAFGTALANYPAARFILMFDDDEIATPHWLERMVETAERTGAGIVGGPVHPALAEGRRALAAHPAFAPAYDTSGPVPVIYGSGNCLITRATFQRLGLPPFDPGYNFLGGGDTDYFVRAQAAGIAFHWSAEAVITETVPPERLRLRWLMSRGLRIGAINHRIDTKRAHGVAGRSRLLAKTALLLPVSAVRALRLYARTREPSIALHPVLVALGRLLAALRIEPQPYRAV
ncbi:glycosyltransferase [Methylobacterium organophilum]|uniref:glycosyltransferase family 2 protein n=1 Tax=Methylobacterium organophilum TaxID=410 RepID=UPI001F144B68|nr:glycosyltransferase [Methylobacterium organophilum]UMY19623.1 glycosyltransferase [Methylobacterium organophilum]